MVKVQTLKRCLTNFKFAAILWTVRDTEIAEDNNFAERKLSTKNMLSVFQFDLQSNQKLAFE